MNIKLKMDCGNSNREPNILVEWLKLLLCIQEVAGSYLGLETVYLD
jgi:hypothetical protein